MSGQDVGARTRPPAAEKPRLRLDIQALRALAVLLVIANHMLPGRVPGGYIGVDVFFVISGYLITAHLLREVEQTGRVNLFAFWARRIRRLIPAATVVLLFSVVLTIVFLPITVRQEELRQIAAAGAYALNWVLVANSLDYFSSGAAASPVTHYWSLSVEEQFYIVWPLLILAGIFISRKGDPRGRAVTLAAVLGSVFVASLTWGIYSSATSTAAAYFETTGRAWEFAAGGLLAFLPASSRRSRVPLIAAAWVAWGVLGVSAFALDGSSGFPGAAALIPVLATATIIYIGDFEGGAAPSRITSLRPIQFAGEISYSLYLWHWPLILLVPYVLGRPARVRDLLVVLAITVVAAHLTKRFVEDPVRLSGAPLLKRRRWVYAGMAGMLAVLLSVCFTLSARVDAQAAAIVESLHSQSLDPSECFGAEAALSGAECADTHTLADRGMAMLNRLNQNNVMHNGSTCIQGRFPAEVTSCSFGAPEGAGTTGVALVGDSHAHVWSAALNSLALDHKLRVHTYLASGCSVTADPAIEFLGIGDTEPSNLQACGAWRAEVIATIATSNDIDTVVTTARDRAYGTVDGDRRIPDSGAGYASAWTTWLEAGKRVIVINDTPLLPFEVPTCLAKAKSLYDQCTAEPPVGTGPLAAAAERMQDDNFTFLDFSDVFCDRKCHSVIGGIPVFYDNGHMNVPFARSFAPEFERLGIFR